MNDPRPAAVSAPAGEAKRCGVCGWTLAATRDEGCVEGDCSMRPVPKVRYDAAPAGEATSNYTKCPTCGGGISMRDNFAPGRWNYGCVNGHEWEHQPAPASGAPDEDVASALRDGASGILCDRNTLLDAADLIDALRTRLAASERAGEAMREDAERLDWWESQRINTLAPVMDAEGWRLHEAGHLRPLHVPFRRTLREAIDAARAALSPTSPAPSPEERADG